MERNKNADLVHISIAQKKKVGELEEKYNSMVSEVNNWMNKTSKKLMQENMKKILEESSEEERKASAEEVMPELKKSNEMLKGEVVALTKNNEMLKGEMAELTENNEMLKEEKKKAEHNLFASTYGSCSTSQGRTGRLGFFCIGVSPRV